MPEPRKLTARRLVRPAGENHEAERDFWGPHPDAALARLEEELYQVGFQFLTGLHAAAWGIKEPRTLQKAFGGLVPGLPDWGAVAALFRRKDLSPMQLRSSWGEVIDRLCNALFHRRTQEEQAAATALRCHWLGRIRTLTEGKGTDEAPPRTWHDGASRMKREEQEAMEWTRVRALDGMRDLEAKAKQGLVNVLVQARQEGLGPREVQRRCYDRFGELNRDWRRVALTETAAAHANGQLAATAGEEDQWEALWVSCRGGCDHCRGWNGRTFRVVSPDKPGKNGQTEIWAGKTNIGRRAAKKTRQGRVRAEGELWWPCIPCHPSCGCSFVLRRVRRSG